MITKIKINVCVHKSNKQLFYNFSNQMFIKQVLICSYKKNISIPNFKNNCLY